MTGTEIRAYFNKTTKRELALLMKRLLVFTRKMMTSYRISSAEMEEEDVINIAIMKTLSDTRPWNSQEYPDPFPHLAGCIRSELSHYLEKKRISTEEYDDRLAFTNGYNPVEEMLFNHDYTEQLISFVRKESPDLVDITEAIISNKGSKPQELAEILQLNVAEINKKKKRLKRLENKFKEAI